MMKIDLSAEANSEAVRIRAIRARPPESASARRGSGISAATLRRVKTPGLHRSTAIFFTHTTIVDGSGRLVEDLVIPVEVGGEAAGGVQRLFDRCHATVRSVCLAEVARRLTSLAQEYRRGLECATARESRLMEMAQADRTGLVQPGLFDRRAMQDRVPAADSQRQESLNTASSVLVAQQSEVILLLVID